MIEVKLEKGPVRAWDDERRRARDRFRDAEAPTAEAEEWRYSRVGDVPWAGLSDADAGAGQPEAGWSSGRPTPNPDVIVVRVRDGRVVDVSGGDTAGLIVSRLSQTPDPDSLIQRHLAARDRGGLDVFVDLSTALTHDPLVVCVDPGVVVSRPIWVANELTGASWASTQLWVVAGGDSEVAVVESLTGGGVESDSACASFTWIDVGPAARVRVQQMQNTGEKTWIFGSQLATVERDGSLRLGQTSTGATYARARSDVHLIGQGASSELLAVYVGSEQQMHDFRTFQHHVAPYTNSDLLFKGAVTDSARSVYSGLIHIGPDAKGASAAQVNRNLVLSEGASAESVPNLEIENNEVRCSHASAVGPIDDDQRFFLEARGVPTDVAEWLVVMGYFDEVIERLPVGLLAAQLHDAIEEKIAGSFEREVRHGA